LSRVEVIIDGVMNWMIGFIDTLFTQSTRDYRQYSAMTDLHTLLCTVTHALGFTVFTTRILLTDFSQSHCHFKSHIESSFRSLIHFLRLFRNFQSEDSTQYDSSAPNLISWQGGVSNLDFSLCSIIYVKSQSQSYVTTDGSVGQCVLE
jgi:hypothetical protein